MHTAGAANTGTTILSLLHGSGLFTLPGGSLNEGDELEIDASGQMNTVLTTPGTLIFTINFGATLDAIAQFTSQAIALNATAQTNATWSLKMRGVVRSVGSGTSANILWTGEFTSRAGNGSAVVGTSGVFVIPIPDTAPATGTGFDSTVSNIIDLRATLSVAGSMTCMRYKLKHEAWRP